MPQPSRLPKVRTGCLTCKSRKVKCDETKPTCARCDSTGRTCGGYDMIEQSLTWYRPQQLTAHDQAEGRAFQFFCRNVGPVLSGPRDAYFWTHLVMQFSHFAPAVRHCVLAISSLYEDFQNGRRVSSQLPSNPFAIKHYAASISHIKASRDEGVVLLACILYLCVEYLLGDVDAAAQHCHHGISILARGACTEWVREHLLPIFHRLSTLPFFSHEPLRGPLSLLNLAQADGGDGAPFSSLTQAEVQLEVIAARARSLGPFHASNVPTQHREAVKDECSRLIEEWQSRMAFLVPSGASQSSADIANLISLRHLRARHDMLRVKVATALANSEMEFDQHLESFQSIVTLADEVLQLQSSLPESAPRPCFTFEEGFLPPLTFTVNKCRDLPTRLKALELMGKVAVAKEGPLDVGTLYRAGRRAVEIEHGMSRVHLSPIRDCVEEYPLPPEERRILGTAVTNHRLEVATRADGSTWYRRPIKILTRTADGHGVSRVEYITDDMAQDCPGIPSMRCSRS